MDIETYARRWKLPGYLDVVATAAAVAPYKKAAARPDKTKGSGAEPRKGKTSTRNNQRDDPTENALSWLRGGSTGNNQNNQQPVPICGMVAHWFEGCDRLSYVENGVLTDKDCHVCRLTFKCTPRVDGEEGYWPSQRNIAWHCVTCKIAVCAPCKSGWDLLTPPRGRRG